MCGIAGWFCWGSARPSPNTVQGLLLANQTRGRDASGFAYVDGKDNTVHIRKAKGPADAFLKQVPATVWEKVAQSPIGLLHARATSQGTEDNNLNNHPVTGLGWCVVHNGHIRNDDDLWKHYEKKAEIQRFAEVDTSAIPLVLSRGTDYLGSLENLTMLSGSATAALLSLADTTKLALMRTGHNDLYLSVDPAAKILYYTSAGIGARILPNLALDTLRFLTLTRLPAERVLVLDRTEDYKATMYRLEMRPFFPQRSGGSHRTSTPAHSTSTSTEKPRHPQSPAAHAASAPAPQTYHTAGLRIKWEPQATDGGKPTPLPYSPHRFSWQTYEPDTIVTFTADLEVGQTRNLQTAYGRWIFRKSGTNKIHRRFRPIKSVKKWFKKKHGGIELPVLGDSQFNHPKDDALTLERLMVTEPVGVTGQTPLQMLGWVCPWCGAHARHSKWSERLFRCWMCGLRSKQST